MLTEYLPGGTTISDPYFVSIIERLRCAILKKRLGKVSDGVLLLHDNGSVYKCNIVQTAIRKVGFVELSDPVYSPDIASCDYCLFSNLKKFLCGKNFSPDDETVDIVEDYLNRLDAEFFCKGIESWRDCWQHVVAA